MPPRFKSIYCPDLYNYRSTSGILELRRAIYIPMKKINLQELAIVIAVKEVDPTLVTPDFLKYSQIVPSDWEVAGQPLRNFQGSQIVFQNGVSVIAQQQRISFAELAVDKDPSALVSAQLATKLVDVLPSLNYAGVGINLRGYVNFGSDKRQARDFMFQNLLAPGAWKQLGNAPVQAGINLGYTFEERRLNLTINEATLQTPDNQMSAIALFNGNFDYDLATTVAPAAHTQTIKQIVTNWQRDFNLYQEVVAQFMLTDAVISFPSLV
jgi:hypothetical protein